MKIGIVATVPREAGGTYQYTQVLIESLINYTKHDYVIIKQSEFNLPPLTNNNYQTLDIRTAPEKFLRVIRNAVYVSWPFTRTLTGTPFEFRPIKKYDIDLIINPLQSLMPLYVGKNFIATIHDLQHMYFPEYFSLRERLARNYIYKNAAQNASLVVCESHFVRKDIIKFLSVQEDKIRILISPPPRNTIAYDINAKQLQKVRNKYDLSDNFLFYPAQFWYHKNHVRLIQSIRFLGEHYHEEIPLILVGSKKNNFKNVQKEITKLRLEKQVRWLGYVDEEELCCLYKLSTALVMPSLFESVSLPVWEAFHLGVPVVSSNACALPEQVGDAGLIFDPHKTEDMAEKIYKVWTDENVRHECIKKGIERIQELTYEKYARQWENIVVAASHS